MKVTEKDKCFLDELRRLMDEKNLWIERRRGLPSYFVLRGNYGDRIETSFGLSRQGVRWRFWHIFNEMYVSAYETIFFVERNFGITLRESAMEIARERYVLREKVKTANFMAVDIGGHKNKD